MTKITVGAWRNDKTGSMPVVSGPLGHELVHCEAFPASQPDSEMTAFPDWFNINEPVDLVLKAGVDLMAAGRSLQFQYCQSWKSFPIALWLRGKSRPEKGP
jgi:hypothetical protein